MAKKTKVEVQSNILDVAQEILDGNKENLETLQTVIQETVAEMPMVEQVEQVKVRVSIGQTAISIILAQPELTNQQVLEKVKELFPSAQTTMACIAWYKSKLRKEGKIGARVFKKKSDIQQVAE
jgi:hypothetical protein